jgi:hypothetical protein
MGRGRRNYEQVRTQPEETERDSATGRLGEEDNPPRETTTTTTWLSGNQSTTLVSTDTTTGLMVGEATTTPTDDEQSEEASLMDESDNTDMITVVILDVAQKKFPVQISAHSTVQRLKQKGRAVHKVLADRQRLIFQGRMLQDNKTLLEEKISDGVIVHLFPKPRVLIQDSHGKSISRDNSTASASGGEGGESDADGDGNHNDDEEEGARIPTIIMNADEAQQRSQILVLGSTDYLEAANNVRLFSFMLLIISAIELMNMLSVALGVPQDDPYADSGDDIFPNDDSNDDGNNNSTISPSSGEVQLPWTMANTFDTIISVMGVYVAITGLKATTANTLRLARTYLMGTFLTGIGWCLFNYVMTYRIDKELEKEHHESRDDLPPMTNSDLAWQAMSVMVLPCMVWILCCLRAWQFHFLLREAEQEAEERIRSELANFRGESSDNVPPNNDEEEGVLPVENGTMS